MIMDYQMQDALQLNIGMMDYKNGKFYERKKQ